VSVKFAVFFCNAGALALAFRYSVFGGSVADRPTERQQRRCEFENVACKRKYVHFMHCAKKLC
jgi:hypothetical protein